MKRREFGALLGGAVVVYTLAARAQQPGMPVIGFLHVGLPQPYARMVAAFLQGLSESGFVEGRNVAIEYRWAENQTDRLPAMAADLCVGELMSSPRQAARPRCARQKQRRRRFLSYSAWARIRS